MDEKDMPGGTDEENNTDGYVEPQDRTVEIDRSDIWKVDNPDSSDRTEHSKKEPEGSESPYVISRKGKSRQHQRLADLLGSIDDEEFNGNGSDGKPPAYESGDGFFETSGSQTPGEPEKGTGPNNPRPDIETLKENVERGYKTAIGYLRGFDNNSTLETLETLVDNAWKYFREEDSNKLRICLNVIDRIYSPMETDNNVPELGDFITALRRLEEYCNPQ